MLKDFFQKALTEYGNHIKAEAVKVCKEQKIKMEFDSNKMPLAEKWHNVACNDCAAAIAKMEIK